jgi:hypothetical protein
MLDFTYFADKDTSVLHAGLQAAAAGAERAGRADDAAEYRRRAAAVEDTVRAGAVRAAEAAGWPADGRLRVRQHRLRPGLPAEGELEGR